MKNLDRLARAYRRQGYAVLPAMDGHAVRRMRHWLANMRAPPGDRDGRYLCRDHFVTRNGHRIMRQWRGDFDELARFVATGAHLELIHSLLGPRVRCCYDQFIVKLPNDNGFPWHQDNESWQLEPDTNITVWTTIDDVNLENGCLWVVPESHTAGLLPKPDESFGHDILGRAVPLCLAAGEAIVFSGYTVHGSFSNRTGRPRQALLLQYCTEETRLQGRPINDGICGSQFAASLSPLIQNSARSPCR